MRCSRWCRAAREQQDARRKPGGAPLDPEAVQAELQRLSPEVEALDRRLEALRDELLILPGYLQPLRRPLPLVPELADLDDDQLRRLGLGTVALVLNTDDERVVETLRESLVDALGDRLRPRVDARRRRRDRLPARVPARPPGTSACSARPRAGPFRPASRRIQAALASSVPWRRCSADRKRSRTSSTPLEVSATHSSAACRTTSSRAHKRGGRARAPRRARPLRGDAARVRRRVLGAPARPRSPATGGALPLGRRGSRRGPRDRLRVTLRHRCFCTTRV